MKDQYAELVDSENQKLATKGMESAEVSEKALKELEADRIKHLNQNQMLKSFGKLSKPMFEGVNDTATKNHSGEVDKRRAKNKAARKARKGKR